MFKNYLKIALRNLSKDKLHTTINIFGLAIGFMVAILSIVYIKSEWEYDKWLPHSDNIYRSYRSFGQGPGGWAGTTGPLAKTLVTQIPGVEKATKVYEEDRVLFTKGDKNVYLDKVGFVDDSFFQVFSFPFLHGDAATALNDQNGLVISEKVAKRFFGEENPIGQTLKVNGDKETHITGVLKEITDRTHLDFEVYLRLEEENWDTWLNYGLSTYILKNKNTPIEEIATKTQAQIIPLIVDAWKNNNQVADVNQLGTWKFQPLRDIHLYSKGFGGGIDRSGDIQNLKIFGLIAFIVLLIAAINYMNLATAKASGRAKEVGMRKVSGANRGQLVSQFLSESVVQSLVALAVGLVLAEAMLPIFNQITGRTLQFLTGNGLALILPFIGIGLGIGVLAGIYPAFVLSAYKPVKVLKGNVLKIKGGQTFRQTLVVTQFSISIVLIIFMLFVFQQVEYMQKQDLGFEGTQVVNLRVNEFASAQTFQARKSSFLTIPGVVSATTSSHIPGEPPNSMSIEIEGIEGMQGADMIWLSPDFDKALDLELASGRFLSEEFPNDSSNAVVVNEAFLAYYKLTEDPLNTRIKLFGQTEYGKVVGVVKDFHMQGVQAKISPTFMVYRPQWGANYVSLRIGGEDIPQTLSAIEKQWAAIEPAYPVEMTFLDKTFERQYARQKMFGTTIFYATTLAIFISILGLFGLASFMAEQRTKEIGVRKVLGASVANLINLLIKDFVKLVFIGGLIALPIGYWLVDVWLTDFAFRTNINLLPFVIAILSSLTLAILTVELNTNYTNIIPVT